MKTFIVVLVIFLILYGAGWYLLSLPQRRRNKKHSNALKNAGLEISFLPQDDGDPFEQEKYFPRQQNALLWNRGKYTNVMQGVSSLGKTWLFEFYYETGSGEDLTSYKQTVAAFVLPEVSLPAFSISSAKILQKILPLDFLQKAHNVLMNREIYFDSHPDFSRTYQLRGTDEEALRAMFQPALLEYWESLPAGERWSADATGHWVIVYQDNRVVHPDDLRVFLRMAEEITTLFQRNAPTAQP